MPKLCPICGKWPLARGDAKRCARCYYARRGVPSLARPSRRCVECDGVCSKAATRCDPCYRRVRRGKADAARLDVERAAAASIREPLQTFDDAWARWQETIGMMRDRYKGPAKARKADGRQRVLVVPDLHVPFHEREMFADMLARERRQTDLAICIGDVGDSYALSRFAKYESVPYAQEWAEVTLAVQTLSETFPQVRIIVGNHDARLRKALAAQLTPDMVEAVSTMTGGTLCPLTALARRFENVAIARHEVPGTDHSIDWMTVEGDALLAHPERYSRMPGSALRSFEEWAADNAATLGLDEIRLLVMGHTHQLAILPWRAASLMIECGCLCQTQGYMLQARIGGRPQRRGYVWFDQLDGRTDLGSVGYRWLDVEDHPIDATT